MYNILRVSLVFAIMPPKQPKQPKDKAQAKPKAKAKGKAGGCTSILFVFNMFFVFCQIQKVFVICLGFVFLACMVFFCMVRNII